MYIGIIRYLADSTRPDVAYAAHKLATHCINPTQQHVDAAYTHTTISIQHQSLRHQLPQTKHT
eukprot:Pgem_evm1s5613